MSARVIQFPKRNAFHQRRVSDALARDPAAHDTQDHAARIALQVEEEIARKAARLAVGQRIQMAEARSANMLRMPGHQRPSPLVRLLSLFRRTR